MQITLEAARINSGLTQKQAGEKLHIHLQTVAKYEKDSSKIPINLLFAFSELYGVPVNNIFLGKEYDLNRNNLSNK